MGAAIFETFYGGELVSFALRLLAVWLVGLLAGWLVSAEPCDSNFSLVAEFWPSRPHAALPATAPQLPKPKWVDRGLKAKALLLSTPPGLWFRRVAVAAHLSLIVRCVPGRVPACLEPSAGCRVGGSRGEPASTLHSGRHPPASARFRPPACVPPSASLLHPSQLVLTPMHPHPVHLPPTAGRSGATSLHPAPSAASCAAHGSPSPLASASAGRSPPTQPQRSPPHAPPPLPLAMLTGRAGMWAVLTWRLLRQSLMALMAALRGSL